MAKTSTAKRSADDAAADLLEQAAEESTETTKKFKDFGMIVPTSEMPPVEFELCGKTFHCKPGIQTKKLLTFVRKTDDASGAEAGDALFEFMEASILPEDIEAWREIVDGDEYIVDASILADIVTWLVEQYSERPTKR